MTKIFSTISNIRLHGANIILVLLLSITLGSIGVGLLVQNNPLIEKLDEFLYENISAHSINPLIYQFIKPTNENFLPGPMPSFLFPMVFGALLIIIFFKPKSLTEALFCFIFGTWLSFMITALDWQLVFRERPFVHLPNHVDDAWKEVWRHYSSFPSGHVRETTFYATLISHFIPRLKIPLFLFVIFVGWSRIYLGAHYPTDVLAGAIIGYLTAKTTILIFKELVQILPSFKSLIYEKYFKN